MSARERFPRVILAGDSTVAPYVATAYPMSGWGAHLGAALSARCAGGDATPLHVVDLAKNGATTQSHREDGLWAAVLDAVAAGDLVLLQFGHNDQKHEHLSAWSGYTENLARMIQEVRDRGAHPVLCTPVARRHYADGRLLRTHGEHPAAVFALAETFDVPLLDLQSRTRDLIEGLGEEPSRSLFTQLPAGSSLLYPDGVEDNTHYSVDGAIAVAEIVAELLAPLVRSTRGAQPSVSAR
ncbi:GDSL family lipase [Brachybacterium ginsengisoli]|uniref:GDSL family lipase n=1 Tax=Brachybacterium ginsengisoli TaxID=1331682 RepID=A0A291GU49_9MICO|nr:rhamnogalacturonan acetylesterase [Brachybacterium ginsengisoli]ATG53636.1 GDSL family lipase [Brachybacterium ginsengisoli]